MMKNSLTYEEFKAKWVAELSELGKLPANKCTCYISYDYKFSLLRHPALSVVTAELFVCVSNIRGKALLSEFKKEAEKVGINYQWMNGDFYKIIEIKQREL